MPLFFEFQGDFRAVRGFTRTLQAAHHHDCGRMRGACQSAACTAHKRGQFLVDNLDNHLRGGQTFHNLRADGTLGNLVGKIFCDFIVDVCFQKCQTHLAHGFFYVAFIQTALLAQPFECGL